MPSSDDSGVDHRTDDRDGHISSTAPDTTDADAVTAEIRSTPSDAFQVLGNEIRMGILETMFERATDQDRHSRMRFSELFETTDLETTAQFAYHLEQLVGPYLRKAPNADSDPESGATSSAASSSATGSSSPSFSTSTDGRTGAGYELTYAGRKIAREIAAGAYTRRVDHPPIELEEACPFCDTEALEAHSTDNVVTIECTACESTLLTLQFPPSGLEAHGERLPDVFSRRYRHHLALAREGLCPECGGSIDASIDFVSDSRFDSDPSSDSNFNPNSAPDSTTDSATDLESTSTNADSRTERDRNHESNSDAQDHTPDQEDQDREYDRVRATFECNQCGYGLRSPVTLSLLEHPAVVSFYHDHDRSIRDRPIWNVGHEWAESVLSRDPSCVRVVTELEGDVLALYVDSALHVRDVQRTTDDPENGDWSTHYSSSEPTDASNSTQTEPKRPESAGPDDSASSSAEDGDTSSEADTGTA